MFYETILPMLELTGTSLLAISTPLDEFNYYSKLVEQKDDHGKPFFKTVKAGRICDDCMRLPFEQMLKCDHVVDGAHWKNAAKLKRLKALYEGDEARGARELGGVPMSSYTACFQKADIEGLYLNPLRVTRAMPRCIYITVDPNGGGMSKMGMTSGYFDGIDTVVCPPVLFHPPLSLLFVWECVSPGIPRHSAAKRSAAAAQHCSDWAEAHCDRRGSGLLPFPGEWS
jgi:hypothetical protein